LTDLKRRVAKNLDRFAPKDRMIALSTARSVLIMSGEIEMPFRSMSTLQSWLDEFAALGYPIGASAKVIPQDAKKGPTQASWCSSW